VRFPFLVPDKATAVPMRVYWTYDNFSQVELCNHNQDCDYRVGSELFAVDLLDRSITSPLLGVVDDRRFWRFYIGPEQRLGIAHTVLVVVFPCKRQLKVHWLNVAVPLVVKLHELHRSPLVRIL